MSTMTVYQSKMNEQMEQFDALMRAQILKMDQRTQQLAMLANNTLGGNIGSSPMGQMILGNLVNSPTFSPFMGGNILNTYGALSNAYGQSIMDVGLHFGGGRSFMEGFAGRGVNTAAVASEMTRQINNEFFSIGGSARNGGNYNHNDIGAAIALLGTNGYFAGRGNQQWGQVYQFSGDPNLVGVTRGASVFGEAVNEIERLRSSGQTREADEIRTNLNRYRIQAGSDLDGSNYDLNSMSEGLTLTSISKDKRDELTRMLKGMTAMLTSAKDVFKTLKEDSPALFQAVEALTGESVTTLNGASIAQQKLERFQRFARTTGRDSEQLASQAIQSSVALANATGMPLVMASRITENAIFDSITAGRTANAAYSAARDLGYDIKAPNEAKINSYLREAQMAVIGENEGLMLAQFATRHNLLDRNNPEVMQHIRTITGDRSAPGAMERIRNANSSLTQIVMGRTGMSYEELVQTAAETMTGDDAEALGSYAREGASAKAWTYVNKMLNNTDLVASDSDAKVLSDLIATVGTEGAFYIMSAGEDADLMNDRRFSPLSEQERRRVLAPGVRDLLKRNRSVLGMIAENSQSQGYISTLASRQQAGAEFSDFVGRSVGSSDLTQTGIQGTINNIMSGLLGSNEEIKRLTEDSFVKASVVSGWSEDLRRSRELYMTDSKGNLQLSDNIGDDSISAIMGKLGSYSPETLARMGLSSGDLSTPDVFKNKLKTLNNNQLQQVFREGLIGTYNILQENTKGGGAIYRGVTKEELDAQRRKNINIFEERHLENLRNITNPEGYVSEDANEEIIGYTNARGEAIALHGSAGYMFDGKHGVTENERDQMLKFSEDYRAAQRVLNNPNATEEQKKAAQERLNSSLSGWESSGFDKLGALNSVTEDSFRAGGSVRADSIGRSVSWLSNNNYVAGDYIRKKVEDENIDSYIAAANFKNIQGRLSVVDGKIQISDLDSGNLRELTEAEQRYIKGAADSGLFEYLTGDRASIKANRDNLTAVQERFGYEYEDLNRAISQGAVGSLDKDKRAALLEAAKTNFGGDINAMWNSLSNDQKDMITGLYGTGADEKQKELARERAAAQLGASNTSSQYENDVVTLLKAIVDNTKNGTPPN